MANKHKQKVNNATIIALKQAEFHHPLMEAVKRFGLEKQVASLVGSLRLADVSDNKIVERLNTIFAFTGEEITVADFRKSVIAYKFLLDGYAKGPFNTTEFYEQYAAEYLKSYFDNNPDDAGNAVKWYKALTDKIVKEKEAKNVADAVSAAGVVTAQTSQTLSAILGALNNVTAPDTDSPDDEEIEYEREKEE
jgi:hypothetical protein